MKKIIATVLAMVMALALCTTAFAATGDVTAKSIRKTDASKNVWISVNTADSTLNNITLTYHKAVAVKTNSDGEATNIGTTETSAHVAYYTIDTAPNGYLPSSVGEWNTSTKLVPVSTLAAADYVVYYDATYDSKKGNTADAVYDESGVVLYLAALNPYYVGVGTKFTNIGTKCGQVDLDTDETYYTSNAKDNNNIYNLVDVYTSSTTTMLVDGNLVPVEYTDKDTDDDTVAHKATPTVKDGKVTGYTCTECKLAAIEAPNYASIPSGAQKITGNWYFPAVAASDTKTDDNKSTSPKTFDAGIAMYVGMALTSVAGSAVVIGKKKEF